MSKCKVIALTGGIGSGKSVVSQLLHTMGYTVYDCDKRAQWVMTHDEQLIGELQDLFGAETYLTATDIPSAQSNDVSLKHYVLNKPYLSNRIFGNPEALVQMNRCVHPAVARDLQSQIGEKQIYFFESAILYESGFNKLVPPDEVWTVSAPMELRIERAMLRDNASRAKIESRISSQMPQEEKESLADHIIYNDNQHSLIEQTVRLLSNLI